MHTRFSDSLQGTRGRFAPKLPPAGQAIALAARVKPDLVVMDICMLDRNGLEATRRILKQNPQMQVLILTMHESEQLVRDVLSSGARGYLIQGRRRS